MLRPVKLKARGPHNPPSECRAGRPLDMSDVSQGSPKNVRGYLDNRSPESHQTGTGQKPYLPGPTVHKAALSSQLPPPAVPVLRILLAANRLRRLARGT